MLTYLEINIDRKNEFLLCRRSSRLYCANDLRAPAMDIRCATRLPTNQAWNRLIRCLVNILN